MFISSEYVITNSHSVDKISNFQNSINFHVFYFGLKWNIENLFRVCVCVSVVSFKNANLNLKIFFVVVVVGFDFKLKWIDFFPLVVVVVVVVYCLVDGWNTSFSSPHHHHSRCYFLQPKNDLMDWSKWLCSRKK